MKFSHYLNGYTLKLIDRLVPVKPMVHNQERQSQLDSESRRMHLYFSQNSAASIRVKRFCDRVGLHVVEKDVERVNSYCNELLKEGGQPNIPCLRLELNGRTHWLYGPNEIVQFLNNRYGFYQKPLKPMANTLQTNR